LGLDEVLTDLENEGYTTRTFNIPACAVGAPHQRYRLWIVANLHSGSEPEPTRPEQQGFNFGDVGNPEHHGSSPDQGPGGVLHKPEEPGGTNTLGESAGASSTREHVADTESERTRTDNERLRKGTSGVSGGQRTNVADPNESRLEGHGEFTEHRTEEGRTDTQRQSSEGDIPGDVGDTNNTGHRTSQHEVERKGKAYITNRKGRPQSEPSGSSANLSDTERMGRTTGSAEKGNIEGQESSGESYRRSNAHDTRPFEEGWWESEPAVGRVAHGIPNRVSQLRALGNSVVPQVVKEIGLAILGENNDG
jgi:site-specific DNA-cytosine methylase